MSQQEFVLVERLVRAIEANTKAVEAHAAATNKLADAVAESVSHLKGIEETLDSINYKTEDRGNHP